MWKEGPEVARLPSLEEPFWSNGILYLCGAADPSSIPKSLFVLPLLEVVGFDLCFSCENMGLGRILEANCPLWKSHV